MQGLIHREESRACCMHTIMLDICALPPSSTLLCWNVARVAEELDFKLYLIFVI